MNVMFPIILGISSSQVTNSIIFQRGIETTNQLKYMMVLRECHTKYGLVLKERFIFGRRD